VTIQPNIGLDAAVRQSIIEILNILLADETVLAHNTRNAADQASGTRLPDLCFLFETQYKLINDLIIEIVERVRILGGFQIFNSEKLVDSARLDMHPVDTADGIRILADQEAFIRFLREDA
jgi:starvation-inducible DNA-binding protein